MSKIKDEITIVIPSFNRADLISRAIKSAQAQTLSASEIIVVDDASTDHTLSVIRELAEKDSRIRYLKHERNLGGQAARNTGILAARGEWISFLDSDDEFLPHKIEEQRALADRAGCCVVHCECYIRRIPDTQLKLFGTPAVEGNVYKQLLCRPGPTFPGLMVKKECLAKIGMLDGLIQAYQEWDTSIRLARHFTFGFVAEPLFIYHLHDTPAISKDMVIEAQGYEHIVNKHAGEIQRVAGKHALSNHYLILAKKFHTLLNFKTANQFLFRYGQLQGLDTIDLMRKRIELLFPIGKTFMKNRQYSAALAVFDEIMYTPADNKNVQKHRRDCLEKIGRPNEIPPPPIKKLQRKNNALA